MIDQAKLERILSSWKKTDPNSFREFFDFMFGIYDSVQAGIMTSNDFNQIKFLQGLGTMTSVFISISQKLLKTDNLIE